MDDYDDEEEAFDYESIGSDEAGMMDIDDQDDQQDAQASSSKPVVETITIDSDSDEAGDDDEQEPPQTPPEPVHTASKGKLSSRKQFQVDAASLTERWGASSSDLVKSACTREGLGKNGCVQLN